MAVDPKPMLVAASAAKTGAAHRKRRWFGTLLSFERRWAEQALSAFAPNGGAGLSAGQHEVDYASTAQRMLREVTPLAAIVLRLSIWLAAFAPLWLWGKLVTISTLSAERRAEMLRALLTHRFFAVRELTLLLKLCAAMALLGAPAVRARSGYDQATFVQLESGLRTKSVHREGHATLPPVGQSPPGPSHPRGSLRSRFATTKGPA